MTTDNWAFISGVTGIINSVLVFIAIVLSLVFGILHFHMSSVEVKVEEKKVEKVEEKKEVTLCYKLLYVDLLLENAMSHGYTIKWDCSAFGL